MLGDQHANGREAAKIGFGLHLNFQTMTEGQVSGAITRVLSEPQFAQTAQEYGSAVVDQKEHPLDRQDLFLGNTLSAGGASKSLYTVISHSQNKLGS